MCDGFSFIAHKKHIFACFCVSSSVVNVSMQKNHYTCKKKSANNHVTVAKLTSVATGALKAAFVPGTTDDAVIKLFYDLSVWREEKGLP